MATRLDRLVLLLDTGSSAAVRQTAAQQIAEIHRQHPSEIFNLLSRVVVHLRSKTWDTRIAAGQALEAIASNIPDWPVSDSEIKHSGEEAINGVPATVEKREDEDMSASAPALEGAVMANKLSFDTFNIESVLANGRLLLGSAGKEYELDLSDLTPQERLAQQKKNLKKRLGLDNQFMDVDLFDDADIDASLKTETNANSAAPADAKAEKMEIDTTGLSKRELNRLKRKLKKEGSGRAEKKRTMDAGSSPSATPSKSETPIKQESAFDVTEQPQSDKVVVESKVRPQGSSASEVFRVPPAMWPFSRVCEHLCEDLFDPGWEIRHGAAIGLRCILKGSGKGAGKVDGAPDNEANHDVWMEDVAIRLLCVFALDRFADFISDQVVCPVRETCSQTLGALVNYMKPEAVKRVHSFLLMLIHQREPCFGEKGIWEVRHAGLLGLKYVIAVRKDIVQLMLAGTIDAVVLGLRDHDDDVRAVSAASLLPITTELVQSCSTSKVTEIVMTLWDCLLDLKDDLSSSTGAVMDLLARLFESETVMENMRETASLKDLLPRLYPFFRHTITNVRLSVLNAIATFLERNTGSEWVDDIIFRLSFQNILLEERDKILAASVRVWDLLSSPTHLPIDLILSSTQNWLGNWFELTMTPIGQPLETRNMYIPSGAFGAGSTSVTGVTETSGHNIDVGMVNQDFSLISMETVLRGRLGCSTALGKVMSVWSDESMEVAYKDILLSMLVSSWAIKRHLSAIVIEEWARARKKSLEPSYQIGTLVHMSSFAKALSVAATNCLGDQDSGHYFELTPILRKMKAESAVLVSFASQVGNGTSIALSIPALVPGEVGTENASANELFSPSLATQVLETVTEALFNTKKQKEDLKERRMRLSASINQYNASKQKLDINVSAAVASAVITLESLPAKLNPIVRSVMNSIKFEANMELQERAATSLASLILLCVHREGSTPSDKIIKNLCVFLCSDTTEVPLLESDRRVEGILTLQRLTAPKDKEDVIPTLSENQLMKRGAQIALAMFCETFGAKVFDTLPKLRSCMISRLIDVFGEHVSGGAAGVNAANDLISANVSIGQEVIDALIVTLTVFPSLHPDVCMETLTSTLPSIGKAIQCKYAVVRSVAARCLAIMCNVATVLAMPFVVTNIIPLLGDSESVVHRQGAAETIHHLVQMLDAKILPYVVFLIVPILGRMSDPDDEVRLIMTNCFASVIKLVPLEAGIPDPEGMSPELLQHREQERKFLGQLLDNHKVDNYTIPVKINAELRRYQQDGVNWLAFLKQYHLHGILCDDMGLGKTLQSICILASDQFERQQKFKETGSPDSKPLPSLVVCPPTLAGHWAQEVRTYTNNLKSLLYTGGPMERKRLRSLIPTLDVVIMSYDIVRNDIDDLCKIDWNYCILDEGHIIKNGKTKITKAVKSIKANHRLILSGTPIQNNVLELWSLFDFLMPGFLGTEKLFNDRFGKPILASKDAKSSSKEQEAGALALEALHKQVLPFLLRRLKEDVLHDLPPKIIQDYYCELSDVQKHLYEDFAKSQARRSLDGEIEEEASEKPDAGKKNASHIFQALQYLRKLCNHPLLVINDKHPEYAAITNKLARSKSSLHDIENAPKLLALKQLLLDCGIGMDSDADNSPLASTAVSQHRALIFCQLKIMLDIIESDLLKPLMSSVSYLRLDGSVDANKRHEIVQKFNADPSIDVLLLTTHVGGLGLNLTGADTVIFVEHDWNPMKDLQAMDRAHRIGQKKVVNVYRLITRGTLEEKIMGLQKFKLNIASSIVNQQNSGLQSMDTDQILDLFNVPSKDDEKSGKKANGEQKPIKKQTAKAVIENLETMWDEKQYDEEFNLDSFIQNLR
ncbi:hypothetical protein BZG36_04331 [Bifiguratus adelaidae]|uniref:TATA-binding protein-associated factor mot1 n=1 Tax=Bifiguratus adelaidae TaxID=1938954 RepID=A0A261XW26_9FUNG|nr:hypothetical protein BZG36_04331 [Bifiguratus adelaidae]